MNYTEIIQCEDMDVSFFFFSGSSTHPTCWAVVSEDTTDVLIAREKELYRLKQDEYHTSAMVKISLVLYLTKQ